MTSFHPVLINDEKSTLKKRLIQSLSASDAVRVFRLPQMVSAINHRFLVWDIDQLPWSAPQISPDQRRYLTELYPRCFKKCRRVFASSDSERQQAHFDEIVVIPNVALAPERSDDFESSEKAPILLFVGNLNHAANIDGLAFFIDSILPKLAGSVPNVLLKVIGRSPIGDGARAAVNRFRVTSRAQFVFDVPSCTPYYLQAVASISPVLYGGGTRIKIIESFAHRCPVVSTKKGCEGLGVVHRKHLLIDDTPDGFASACVELIQAPQLREQIAETANGFFECNHSQGVVDRLLVSAFQDL